jgi:type II secretory pathway pseudopilin PulG
MTHQSFQDKVRTRRITREVFVNDDGAIDLASIMVGIIVIGLIGAIIAATIFAVIPWAQDNAAKQQLDSVKSAEDAYRGLAEDSGISKYGNNLELAKPVFKDKEHPSLLDLKESDVLITTTPGPNPTYTATIKSASGKTFTMTNGGKVKETETPADNPPATGNSMSFANGQMFLSNRVSQASMPADRTNSLTIQAAVSMSQDDYAKLTGFFKGTSFTPTDGYEIPDTAQNAYTTFGGIADVYLSRPKTVTIQDMNNKTLGEYSGTEGTVFMHYKAGDTYGWSMQTALPDAVSNQMLTAKGYNLTFNYDGFTISAQAKNPDYAEPGPTGSGSDVASKPVTAFSVNYAPVNSMNGQGYSTQEEYDNALVTRETDMWSFQITASNPDPQSLPDLSDVPFTQQPDGTFKAVMFNGTDTQPNTFTFADGQTTDLVGNADMASVNSNLNDYRYRVTILMDANKNITSLKVDFMAVRIRGYSTLEEAKAKFAGSTLEIHPHATKTEIDYQQVSTMKTIKFIFN